MGGKESKEITRNDIETSIKTEINNLTKNITNILNESITDTTNAIITENAQEISNSTGGTNQLTIKGIEISDNGVFDVTQAINLDIINRAAINVTQDASALGTLANQLSAGIIGKVKNDTTLTQAMEAKSKLDNSQSTAGGINDMIGNVTKMMGDVLTQAGSSKMDKESETTIKNKIMTTLNNTTINENNVKAIIETHISNKINQMNSSTCRNTVTAGNAIDVGNVNISGNGKVVFNQSATIKAVNSCIIGAAQTSDLTTKITSGTAVTVTTDTSNKNSVENSMKADSTIDNSKKTGDAFGEMISSFSPFAAMGSVGSIISMICCGCFCIICILAIGYFAFSGGGGDGDDDSEE